MKALIGKLYLAAKHFFFLWNAKVDVLTKRCELKCVLRFNFVPAIGWTTVFSYVIQYCELRQF